MKVFSRVCSLAVVLVVLFGFNCEIWASADIGHTLWRASLGGEEEKVTELLKKGTFDQSDINDSLVIAASRGYLGTVQLLIAAKADINARESFRIKNTALNWASHKGHVEVVRLLLVSKAIPDITNTEDETAIISAAENGHTDIVSMLADAGADVNAALKLALSRRSLTRAAKVLTTYKANLD